MSSHLQQLKLGHLSTDIAASYGADPLETFWWEKNQADGLHLNLWKYMSM